MPVLDSIPPGSRVLIIKLRSLGDCVLSTPAIRLLKQFRNDLDIGVAVEARFRAVFENNPDIAAALDPSPAAAAVFHPAMAINFHGGTRSVVITAASAARWRVGFAHFRHSAIYNVRIPRAQEILREERTVHTAEHMASAMFYLGVPHGEIPRSKLYNAAPDSEAAPITAPYAVIHPLASAPAKTWPAQRFAAVARHLRESAGLDPIFIGARDDDLSAFAAFRCVQGAPFTEIKNLLSRAALFVGNDSGPAHMAAAFAVPSVVLFGDSDARVWAPWRTLSETVEGGEALDEVPVARVVEALERLAVSRSTSRR